MKELDFSTPDFSILTDMDNEDAAYKLALEIMEGE